MAMENYNPPQDPWLVILYQDEHIMVVNKPSGLLSVPGRLEEHKDSVMTRVQRDFPQAESVHRLDMATSGVIVVALTKAAERELKRQFREREPKKQYVARVWGHPEKATGNHRHERRQDQREDNRRQPEQETQIQPRHPNSPH